MVTGDAQFVEKMSASEISLKSCLSDNLPTDESQIAVLLKKYSEEGDADRVYSCLHKLRRIVRCVSSSTAKIIQDWFLSDFASKVGREPCNSKDVADRLSKYGGGGHLLGWLGKGKWNVSETKIHADGSCSSCGGKVVFVDSVLEEPKEFIDCLREDFRSLVDYNSVMAEEDMKNFTKFEDFLEKHDKYTVVVDGVNIARCRVSYGHQNLLHENDKLVISQIDDLLYQLDEDAKPLVIMVNEWYQIALEDLDNKVLLDKWEAQDMLYIVPESIYDVWYMAYASLKLRCGLVTNDVFRNDMYQLPFRKTESCVRWCEKSCIYYDLYDIGETHIDLFMPRPYSIDIQESEEGFWHVPVEWEVGELEDGATWLCITRPRKRQRN